MVVLLFISACAEEKTSVPQKESVENSDQAIQGSNTEIQEPPSWVYFCPDKMEYHKDLPTLVVKNEIKREMGKDEQDWISENCNLSGSVQGIEQPKTDQPVSGVQESGQNLEIPNCPENINGILNHPIIENQYLDRISPLGHVKADDRMHVIPISHIYYVNSKPAQVFAPADVWIESIDSLTQIDALGNVLWSDFNIYMSPCREIKIDLYHVRNLSDDYKQRLNESEENCSTDPPTAKRRYKTCHAEVKRKIKAGEPIGWGGGYGNLGLDVAAYDSRIKNNFISPERYRFTHLQGICFLGAISADQAEKEGKVLSIVHFELEPPSGIIATSGTIVSSPGMLAFIPRHEGSINREPSEVKDSNTYCFQHEDSESIVPAYSSVKPFTGRMLIQLIDPKTLKAEYQEKKCNETFNFVSPTLYER